MCMAQRVSSASEMAREMASSSALAGRERMKPAGQFVDADGGLAFGQGLAALPLRARPAAEVTDRSLEVLELRLQQIRRRTVLVECALRRLRNLDYHLGHLQVPQVVDQLTA